MQKSSSSKNLKITNHDKGIILLISNRLLMAIFRGVLNEPRREKTGLRGFRPGPT